ncbi:MAG: methyl-accepting chemotaxis protein, partial [Deltaproteobacteria bacterium]|nr:methyl-accepting chemotaxis protein [Deltaproteobacteria bacterium]
MKGMKLSVKLTGSFLVLALIVLMVGLWGWIGISRTDKALAEVVEVRLQAIVGLSLMREAQTGIQRLEGIFLIDQEALEKQIPKVEEAWKLGDKGWEIYEPLPKSDKEMKLWKEFVPLWTDLKNMHGQAIVLIKKGDVSYLKIVNKLSHDATIKTAFKQGEKILGEIIDLNVKAAEENSKAAKARTAWAKTLAFAGMIIGAIVSFVLGIFLSHSITKPLNRVVEGLTEGAEQVSSASGQISQASQQVAQGSGEQASGIEETSSSLEEIASMTRQNASNAREANGLMSEVGTQVNKGKESMDRLGV